MPWFKRPHRRLEPYTAPPSEQFLELMRQEADAIAQGDTAGLDPTKPYLAVRVTHKDQPPSWVVCASPFDPRSITDGEVMFVASVTFATAIYLAKQGAAVH